MKYLVFEDEELVAKMLISLIKQCRPDYNLIEVIPSVETGIKWLKKNPKPDIIFMDIQLSDGSCFEIFSKIHIDTPIIFTTAYDQYAIQAFKVNSIDYLVKPIDLDELKSAIDKFEKLQPESPTKNQQLYEKVMQQILKSYKQRFLVKIGEQFKYIDIEDIAYFIFDDRLVYACSKANKKIIIDYSLDQVEKLIDPDIFFRINRQFIISINCIDKIHTFFNQRLKLKLNPSQEVVVSRDRVSKFKLWLDK